MAARLRVGKGRAAGAAGFQAGTGYAAPSAPTARPLSAQTVTQGPVAQAAPPDPVLLAALTAGQLSYAQQIQANQYERGQLGSVYGLRGDAQGGVFDDPSNPYSRAAALQESYDNAKRGNTNNYAARGQLYAGSLQNAQNTSADGFNKGRSALINEFLGRQAALNQSDLAARNGLESGALSAQAEALERARINGNNAPPETVAPAGAAPAAPGAAPKAKPKAGYQFVQDSGTRAGLSYKLVPGAGGTLIRLYENGDRVARP